MEATVVKAWKDTKKAYLAVRVAEANGEVEYVGSVPVAYLIGKTAAQQKTALIAAVKAIRDAQMITDDALGITGSVTI